MAGDDWDIAACGLAVIDAAGIIQRINPALSEWLGYTSDELTAGQRFHNLLGVGSRIFFQTHALPLVHTQGSVAELKLDFRHRDGSSRSAMANARQRPGGGFSLAVFVANDRIRYEQELLRTRKRSEEALALQWEAQRALQVAETSLRLALETARVGIWRADGVGNRTFSNSMALLLGFEAPAPIDEEAFAARIHPTDRDEERATASVYPEPGASPDRRSYRLIGVDGHERIVEACSQGVFNDSGDFLEIVGVVQDVTVLSRRSADAEDRALLAEQMVGIVSHDLRNPLTAISAGLELLGEVEAAARQTKIRAHMRHAVERAVRLIHDLLDFTSARLGSGLVLSRRAVDVRAVLSDAVTELKLIFPDQPIQATVVGQTCFSLDPDRLVQLVGNLVTNAVRYGEAGRPINITVATGDVLELEVHNEGPPIPPAQQARLFDAMVRGSTHAQVEGVGLGLFIVRAIARAHGGDVMVRSNDSTGTRFIVRFKGAEADPPAAQRA